MDLPVLAAMLVALALFAGAHQAIWEWLTQDLRDGTWICGLTDGASAGEAANTDKRLVGIEGRFVWAASVLLLLLVMASIVAASAYSVLATMTRWRAVVAAAGALILVGGLLGSGLAATHDYQGYMGLSSAGSGCGFVDREGPFQFSRYLLLIFAPYYEAGASVPLLDGFALFEQLLPGLVMVCNLFLLAALLTLAWPGRDQPFESPGLARRIARFRLLLALGSALFTVISLYYLSQYAWFAQVLAADDPAGAEQLRGLQRGVTLFLATGNSLAIVLLFAPPGWILSRRALALSHREAPAASGQERSEWITQNALDVLSGPVMRVALAAAPLLVSGGLMLLEKALMGG